MASLQESAIAQRLVESVASEQEGLEPPLHLRNVSDREDLAVFNQWRVCSKIPQGIPH